MQAHNVVPVMWVTAPVEQLQDANLNTRLMVICWLVLDYLQEDDHQTGCGHLHAWRTAVAADWLVYHERT